MIARISMSLVLAAGVVWPISVSAQGGANSEGVQDNAAQGIPKPLAWHYADQWERAAATGQDPAPPAEPEVNHIVRGQSPGGPVQLTGGYAPQSGVDSYGDGSGFGPVYREQPLPWERGGDSPIRQFFTDVAANSYIRVEYLNWNVDDIGAQSVGATSGLTPTVQTDDPRQVQFESNAFFGMLGQQGVGATSQTLIVPSTESISFNRVSGVRGTYGIPLQFGRLEFSGFKLEDTSSEILDPSFGPIEGDRVLVEDEFQSQSFILANDLTVTDPFITTTSGRVQAVAQPIGNGQGLGNNIPAGSLIPNSAAGLPPGNPPISIPPLPAGTQTRPLVDLANPLTGIVTFNTPLPTGPFFTQQNFQGQLVTFDTALQTINQANLQGTTPLSGPFYIRGANSATPSTLNPLFAPVAMPNVIDPSRNPIGQFPNRFPGGDAEIIVPPGSFIVEDVTRLLADTISPGGITLPAGTVLRTRETGIPVIPLLTNGQTGNAFLIYDGGYGANYHSDIWGTEAKLILDVGPENNGFSLKPLVGFRYMRLDEQFRQVGLSSLNVLNLDPIQTTFVVPEPTRASIIDSQVHNNLYGMQVGTSAEYNHKWISLGVEPRISMGLNSYEAEVTTNNLRSVLDPRRTTVDEETKFAPVFDVSMYGQVHLTPYFSLHAGYNFTYLFRVTRPAGNIEYNDNGPTAPPGVVVDSDTEDLHIEGLTIGGEFRFRDLKFR